MRRFVLMTLGLALVAVLPVWQFSRQWTYGPAIAVGFLLLVNLLPFLSDRLGRRRDEA